MKKIISLLVITTMIFSMVASLNITTVSAATQNMCDFKYFTEETTFSSGYQNYGYGSPKGMAANPERNNIYNTDILHNKTPSAKPENDDAYWEELERREEQEARKRTWAYRGDALGF